MERAWLDRFVEMDEAAVAAEAAQARRRILGALMDPDSIGKSSPAALAGTLKVLEDSGLLEGGAGAAAGAQAVCGAGAGGRFVMDSLLIADGFAPLRRDILQRRHSEYILPGGRGSTKSSFVSLMLVELLMREEGMHALVVRQVAATLRDSVYAQMRWAVEAMGLGGAWRFLPGRLFMERADTGQRVYFRGADDPTKIKSLKPPFGAIGAVWFEELDQFAGEAAVRNIEQSALRGCVTAGGTAAGSDDPGRGPQATGGADAGGGGGLGQGPQATGGEDMGAVSRARAKKGQRLTDRRGGAGLREGAKPGGGAQGGPGAGGASGLSDAGGVVFKSFNPPRAKRHWANRYAAWPGGSARVFHSDYRSVGVPEEWLGPAFLERAADLEQRDAAAFEHEYLGLANLAGGMVFQNIVAREVTDEELAGFERVYNGADWGWYPDPWAFNRVAYQQAQRRVVIFCERRALRCENSASAAVVLDLVGPQAPVVCDSSEPKSISDWRAAGVMAQAAEKGPASRAYSYKWLAGLDEIVIDPVRCPNTLREFGECSYRMDAGGEATGEIDAREDHHIDAVRYALERVWRRRGA